MQIALASSLWRIMTFWKRFFTSMRCIFKRDYSFKFTKRIIIKSTLCLLNAKCIFYSPRRFLWSFDKWYSSNNCFNKALKNFLKLESSPLKISTSLSGPSRTSYCDVKSIYFPTKASIAKEQSPHLDGPGFWRFWNLVYQIPGGSSPGFTNAPPPGQRTWTNAPGLPGGDGHRWNWLMHYHYHHWQLA